MVAKKTGKLTCLSSINKYLSSIPKTHIIIFQLHPCNPNPGEMKTGESSDFADRTL